MVLVSVKKLALYRATVIFNVDGYRILTHKKVIAGTTFSSGLYILPEGSPGSIGDEEHIKLSTHVVS